MPFKTDSKISEVNDDKLLPDLVPNPDKHNSHPGRTCVPPSAQISIQSRRLSEAHRKKGLDQAASRNKPDGATRNSTATVKRDSFSTKATGYPVGLRRRPRGRAENRADNRYERQFAKGGQA